MLITRLIFIQWKFSTPDQFIASPWKFSLKHSLVPKLSTLSSDPIEFADRPVPPKLDNSVSIFLTLSSQNRTWCCDTYSSNAWDHAIPLLACTIARLTTYCAGVCFKSLASKSFYGEQVPSLSSQDSSSVVVTQNMCVCFAWVQQTWSIGLRPKSPHFL